MFIGDADSCHQDHTWGQKSQGCQYYTINAQQMVTGKGRENGYGARREIADGHAVHEFLRRQPMEIVNELLVQNGDEDKTASEKDQADLEEGQTHRGK